MSKKIGEAEDILNAVKSWVNAKGVVPFMTIVDGGFKASSTGDSNGAGFIKLSNGLIIMWDRVSVASNTEKTMNFPYTGKFTETASIRCFATGTARTAFACWHESSHGVSQYHIRQDSTNTYLYTVFAIGK